MKNIFIAAITITLLSGNSVLAARFCLEIEPDFVILVNKPSSANPILNIITPSCQLDGQRPNID